MSTATKNDIVFVLSHIDPAEPPTAHIIVRPKVLPADGKLQALDEDVKAVFQVLANLFRISDVVTLYDLSAYSFEINEGVSVQRYASRDIANTIAGKANKIVKWKLFPEVEFEVKIFGALQNITEM